MNKKELIEGVATKAEITKKAAAEAVAAVFDVIEGTLAAGDKVQIMGFGTFAVRERAARVGRNPVTNEEMPMDAYKMPTFKAGASLKDAVQA
jgi:DNA-binding protein HU-beta